MQNQISLDIVDFVMWGDEFTSCIWTKFRHGQIRATRHIRAGAGRQKWVAGALEDGQKLKVRMKNRQKQRGWHIMRRNRRRVPRVYYARLAALSPPENWGNLNVEAGAFKLKIERIWLRRIRQRDASFFMAVDVVKNVFVFKLALL